jgi:hypothetical protein
MEWRADSQCTSILICACILFRGSLHMIHGSLLSKLLHTLCIPLLLWSFVFLEGLAGVYGTFFPAVKFELVQKEHAALVQHHDTKSVEEAVQDVERQGERRLKEVEAAKKPAVVVQPIPQIPMHPSLVQPDAERHLQSPRAPPTAVSSTNTRSSSNDESSRLPYVSSDSTLDLTRLHPTRPGMVGRCGHGNQDSRSTPDQGTPSLTPENSELRRSVALPEEEDKAVSVMQAILRADTALPIEDRRGKTQTTRMMNPHVEPVH